jgi:D-alanyl-D-alanine carboxypeptidase
LIAVVLGAPSGGARAVKAAEMLESGFAQNPLSWLTPSLGTVDTLASIDASPPNLKDEMCGGHRSRLAAEEDDQDAAGDEGAASDSSGSSSKFSVMLSALRAPTAKNANLLSDDAPVVPVVVYTGPTRTPAQLDTLAAEPEAVDAVVKKKAVKHKPATAKAKGGASSNAKPADGAALDGKSTDGKSADGKFADGKSADGQSADGKVGVLPWTPMSSSALAASPPPDLKPDSPVGVTAQARPKPSSAANFQQ